MTTTYRYFLLGDVTPIQVSYNEDGHEIGARTPDAATQALKIDHHMLNRIDEGNEIEEIDQSRFEALCGAIYNKKTPPPFSP